MPFSKFLLYFIIYIQYNFYKKTEFLSIFFNVMNILIYEHKKRVVKTTLFKKLISDFSFNHS